MLTARLQPGGAGEAWTKAAGTKAAGEYHPFSAIAYGQPAGDDAQLIDVERLKALDFSHPPLGRHDGYGFVGRASADGKTFTGIPAGFGPVSYDLVAALKKSGRDDLFVDSVPPVRIKRGKSLVYRIHVQAARAGSKFKLETGPEGMTVSKSGEVKWKVPVDFAADSAVAAISILDKVRNETLHTFEVAVQQ